MKKHTRLFSIILIIFIIAGLAGACKSNKTDSSSVKKTSSKSSESAAENSEQETGSETDSTADESGANTNEASNNTSKTSKNGSNTSGVQIPDRELIGNTYTSGFPVVKNKETLTIMAVTRPDVGDQSKSQFSKSYSKLTGIDIKWRLVSEGEANQQKVLALQSGNMPDVFAIGDTYGFSESDVLQYSKEKKIAEITENTLKTYGPNIYNAYNKYNAWNLARDENKKMWSVLGFSKDNLYGNHFLWIRKSWMDTLGVSAPKTITEFYDLLDSFKKDDPNGNGQADEVPYATWSETGMFFAPWGIQNGMNVDSNGKIAHSHSTSNMKNALEFWNKVYRESLVDRTVINNFAGENAAFKTLCASGKVGIIYYGWPGGFLPESLFNDYVPLAWPTSDNNGAFSKVFVPHNEITRQRAYVITSSCKNPTAAIRFLDYLYTNDGYMLKTYGDEGYLYKKSNESTYKTTGKAAAASDILGPKWTMVGRNFLDGATYDVKNNIAETKNQQALSVFSGQMNSIGAKRIPDAPKTEKELNEIKKHTKYFTDIEKSNYWFKYVTGALNLNTDWTALQNEMVSKGLNDYVGIYQNYYNRVK